MFLEFSVCATVLSGYVKRAEVNSQWGSRFVTRTLLAHKIKRRRKLADSEMAVGLQMTSCCLGLQMTSCCLGLQMTSCCRTGVWPTFPE